MYRYILGSSYFACCLLQPCAQLLQLLAVGSSSKYTCIREGCRKSQGSPRWEQWVISAHPRMRNASRGSSSHVLGWNMKTKWNHQQGKREGANFWIYKYIHKVYNYYDVYIHILYYVDYTINTYYIYNIYLYIHLLQYIYNIDTYYNTRN
jgi:hypothetical protein